MKTFLTSFLIFVFSFCQAQLKLDKKDLKNLIAMGEIYSLNPNARGEEFAKSMDSLRTPKLNNIVDTSIEIGKAEKTILDSKFLSRPSNDELIMWYVIREIHYNRVSKTKKPRDVKDVAADVLSRKIDERWLLDNYYYRIRGAIATLFNESDLSAVNINIETLGFKNKTEKAIFFFNIVDGLIGSRFKVLMTLKKNDKIVEFIKKLPKFNNKDYYYYQDFDFEDFDFIGYEITESYKKRDINNLYDTLIGHFIASSYIDGKKSGEVVYYNSILYQPKYFEFSVAKKDLETIYERSK